ncbi:hypothetical protein ATI61_10584 [Archangium gephyra]|uniref:Protein kinase n=1 Tax=Archangium gephyra TaxID=48 RepID=A0ABX9K1S4_9BACT|nr:hypothetical protein [Archangium gephyra]REG31760.1 hypothetical protein ATI61_10584 [Archangium gephyra]
MDEEKKSEASSEDVERVGPYKLHEQVPQDEHSRGELYRATHETSGASSLVLRPTEDGSAPLTDWRVRCISSSSPSYLALEVEPAPGSTASDGHSVEELMCMFEDVHEGVKHMAHALPVYDEPRRRWRMGLALAGVAAACALVFALLLQSPLSQPPGGPDPLARAAPVSDEVPTDVEIPLTGHSFWDIADGGAPVLAHPFPRKPYKGQRRPPCKPRIEVEIMGACWIPHELKAPCPEELYEYQGKCYTTSMLPPQLPQSIEQ